MNNKGMDLNYKIFQRNVLISLLQVLNYFI